MYQSIYITFGNKALYCTVYICLHHLWQQNFVLLCVPVETCINPFTLPLATKHCTALCINLSTLPVATKHCTALCICWHIYQSIHITFGNKALYCSVLSWMARSESPSSSSPSWMPKTFSSTRSRIRRRMSTSACCMSLSNHVTLSTRTSGGTERYLSLSRG